MEKLENEIWKGIKEYDFYYSISNLGRVKSLKRVVTHKRCKLSVNEKIITNCISTFGYPFVRMTINNKTKNFKIHRLIAQAFIPNPENKPQVNHINGIKTDNRVENLEWCTHSENMRHALDTKLRVMKNGTGIYNSKLTDKIVLTAKERYKNEKISYQKLANEYNVSKSVMMLAVKGINWKHLNQENAS